MFFINLVCNWSARCYKKDKRKGTEEDKSYQNLSEEEKVGKQQYGCELGFLTLSQLLIFPLRKFEVWSAL